MPAAPEGRPRRGGPPKRPPLARCRAGFHTRASRRVVRAAPPLPPKGSRRRRPAPGFRTRRAPYLPLCALALFHAGNAPGITLPDLQPPPRARRPALGSPPAFRRGGGLLGSTRPLVVRSGSEDPGPKTGAALRSDDPKVSSRGPRSVPPPASRPEGPLVGWQRSCRPALPCRFVFSSQGALNDVVASSTNRDTWVRGGPQGLPRWHVQLPQQRRRIFVLGALRRSCSPHVVHKPLNRPMCLQWQSLSPNSPASFSTRPGRRRRDDPEKSTARRKAAPEWRRGAAGPQHPPRPVARARSRRSGHSSAIGTLGTHASMVPIATLAGMSTSAVATLCSKVPASGVDG